MTEPETEPDTKEKTGKEKTGWRGRRRKRERKPRVPFGTWVKTLPSRILERLRRIGRWFMSKRGRAIWIRVLLACSSVIIAPYAVVVWRVILYGDATEQCVVFMAVMIIMLIRGGWKRLKTLDREQEEQEEQDDRKRRNKRGKRKANGKGNRNERARSDKR